MGYSGIHDGCPLHGHATSNKMGSGGCICQMLIAAPGNAKKLAERDETIRKQRALIVECAQAFEGADMPGRGAKVRSKLRRLERSASDE